MSTLFAFLHHLAAFTLVSAIAVEFALIRQELIPKLGYLNLYGSMFRGRSHRKREIKHLDGRGKRDTTM